ncbi:MAG: SAM-dependent DNA methyltransferase [Burkholderiales bacterium]|jgi:type I restriction enzyme M protein|nr:SAM-dependent DNA methyltransferase [Burkholderiales bacterium]MBW8891494.1 SAM-dependent DNA methyltransferase [Burkholderiales bacterium]
MNRDQLKKLERDLWAAADKLRANSDLKASEYSTPVLGLIFLKFADNKYRQHETAIEQAYQKLKGTRVERSEQDIAIEKCGFYLKPYARYDYLLNLPEKENIAKAIRAAMASIENTKPELLGVLPQEEYDRFTRSPKNQHIPKDLLKLFSDIPVDASGDVFGQIYEYFLAHFALSEGAGGGEFFTPRSVVKLMTEIIEPHGGKVFDPACGSGGMFVQSADFILKHQTDKAADLDVFVCGTEKTLETVKLAKMNLAVNNLRGEIKQANTYYEDPFNAFGAFDYVMANPPFNVDDVTLDAVEKDRRFNTYGVPRNKTKAKAAGGGKDGKEKAVETVPNGNYLWINLFATSLKPGGRAALVMANSASDARHSEADIRRTLIEQNLIYGMLTLPSNLFYTVTLPATLWFFDKGKTDDKVLFIDARNIFTQVDRAHRELSDEQIQNIALIPRLHKGRRQEFVDLVDRYLHRGMAQLHEAAEHLPGLSQRLLAVLAEEEADAVTSQAARDAIAALQAQWGQLAGLKQAHADHERARGQKHSVEGRNSAQNLFRAQFTPFFSGLHAAVKALDKAIREMDKRKAEAVKLEGKRATANRQTKGVKAAVQALHDELKAAELYYQHVSWLQERFPKAAYEDVTGLCKLASREEIAEQDWSLNPGRYVGVVIEEDGKTEEEFLADLQSSLDELEELDGTALRLKAVIDSNLKKICEAG